MRKKMEWRWKKERWKRRMLLHLGTWSSRIDFLHFHFHFSASSLQFIKTISNNVFSSIPIDYNLYRKFWTLQDYFRNPVQCYDKFSWMTFLKVKKH